MNLFLYKKISSLIYHKLVIFNGLKHILLQDKKGDLWRYFFQKPWKNLCLLCSAFFSRKEKFSQGGYFFHGCKNLQAFKNELQQPKTVLLIGLSYCQRPKDCPTIRFSSECLFLSSSPVCNQCFMHSIVHFIPPSTEVTFIPTAFFLAKKILALQQKKRDQILFLISACPFAIGLFAPWVKFFCLKGISFPLAGAVCRHFSTFQIAEQGAKKSISSLSDNQKKLFLELILLRKRSSFLT